MICVICKNETTLLREKYNLKQLVVYNNGDVYIEGLTTINALQEIAQELKLCIKQE